MDLKIYWCAIKPEEQLVFGLLPNSDGVHIYLNDDSWENFKNQKSIVMNGRRIWKFHEGDLSFYACNLLSNGKYSTDSWGNNHSE